MKRFESKTNLCIYFEKFSLVTSYFHAVFHVFWLTFFHLEQQVCWRWCWCWVWAAVWWPWSQGGSSATLNPLFSQAVILETSGDTHHLHHHRLLLLLPIGPGETHSRCRGRVTGPWPSWPHLQHQPRCWSLTHWPCTNLAHKFWPLRWTWSYSASEPK